MAKFYQPTSDVIELVEKIMMLYHEDLEDASIGILFRDEAPVSNGMITLGMAKKVSEEMRAAGLNYHFIIWFAEDEWRKLSNPQREALVDHELMHCVYDANEDKGKMRPHDFEEFNEIIARHGLWRPGAQETRHALEQMKIPLSAQRLGKIEGVQFSVSGMDLN